MSKRRELLNIQAPYEERPVFKTNCTINGNELEAMIDSGASGTFVSGEFVKRHGIATRKKQDGGYSLIAVDGLALPSVDNKTVLLSLVF